MIPSTSVEIDDTKNEPQNQPMNDINEEPESDSSIQQSDVYSNRTALVKTFLSRSKKDFI